MRSLLATRPCARSRGADALEITRARNMTMRSVRRALCGPAVAALLVAGCTDPTDPVLHLIGTVRRDGAPVPRVRVYLADGHGPYIPVVQLGNATTNDDGTYSLEAPSARDGYVCGGDDHLFLSVEGFGTASRSAPIRCTSNLQRIDLTAVD